MSLGSIVALATERVVRPVEEMHRAIARPWFAVTGSVGQPVRAVHDVISRTVYGLVRAGATVVGRGLDSRPVHSSPGTRAFFNGLWGDALGRYEPHLDTPMTVCDRDGNPIPPGSVGPPTAHIVVLLHGLMATDQAWHGTDSRPGLIRRLDGEADLSPVAIRYNSGLPIAENGDRLTALLEELYTQWPVPVKSIALVGHSMGGLVIHRACASALGTGDTWIERVRDVVTIGSPHGGAPLEKLVNVAAGALRVAPQSRPLAEFLDTRSRGIRDLRRGSPGLDSNVVWATQLPDVKHHFVAGVITSNPTHPIGAIVGDLMVRPASSTRSARLEPASTTVLGGVHHFDLLHDAAVIDSVMRWLVPSG